MDIYQPATDHYEDMLYRRCGRSGLQLPVISLGLWHNFGPTSKFDQQRAMLRRAFDLGVTHFDLANNYGPPPGAAEETFGRILKLDFAAHRDEMIVSTKAGYLMGPGPYGEWGSRKYLIASLNQSLRRLGLEYVDVFYSHRFDPNTPLQETMSALDFAVRSGKALYVGISNYDVLQAREALSLLRQMGTPCVIHQPKYSMFQRQPEAGLLDLLREQGVGAIAFSPLAQGLLTNRYSAGVEKDSRAAQEQFLKTRDVQERHQQVMALSAIAARRGQTLAQMAIAWVLRSDAITSALIGASNVAQIEENRGALKNLQFSLDELESIDAITGGTAVASQS